MFQHKNPAAQSTNRAGGLKIGVVVDHLPEGVRDQYRNVGNIGTVIARMDPALEARLKGIKSEIFIIPVKSLKDIPNYLKDIGQGDEKIPGLQKMIDGLKGDAITVSFGNSKGKVHAMFILTDSFRSLGQVSVTINHDLHHIALFEEGKQGKTRREDGLKAFSQSTASISKIIGLLQQQVTKIKNADQKAVMERVIKDLKTGLAADRKILDTLKKEK